MSPSILARRRHVNGLAAGVPEHWHDDFPLELGLAYLALNAAAVYSNISQICQKLLSTILTGHESKQLRGIINKCSPAVSRNEDFVREKRRKESNVSFDTTNPEFDQGSEHLSSCNFIG